LPREDLTPKEKATLYGLARYPGCNDRELSDILSEKMSTVTSIRRRMKGRGLFFRAMVPSFGALGCEVMAVCYGGVSSGCLVDMKKAQDRGLFSGREDASFFAQIATFSWLELGAFRNYSEAKRKGEGMWRKLNVLLGGVPGHPCTQSYYPMDQLTIHNFFDYTALLGKLFGFSARGDRARAARQTPSRKLTSIERLVFYGLVKYPDARDKVVADRLSVSRQAVARIRRLLVDEGFLTPIIVPGLDKLGYDIVAFFRFHLNPCNTLKERGATVYALLQGVPNIFAFSAGLECVLVGAYCTFPEFEHSSIQLTKRLEDAGRLEAAPEIQTFLLSDTVVVKNHDYLPVVKSMLDLKLDD
jgi:hypothetical protein